MKENERPNWINKTSIFLLSYMSNEYTRVPVWPYDPYDTLRDQTYSLKTGHFDQLTAFGYGRTQTAWTILKHYFSFDWLGLQLCRWQYKVIIGLQPIQLREVSYNLSRCSSSTAL